MEHQDTSNVACKRPAEVDSGDASVPPSNTYAKISINDRLEQLKSTMSEAEKNYNYKLGSYLEACESLTTESDLEKFIKAYEECRQARGVYENTKYKVMTLKVLWGSNIQGPRGNTSED